MPKFASFRMLFAMANCGLPATSGFVGEFVAIVGAVKTSLWYAAAATTLVFGAVANPNVAALSGLNAGEFIVLGLLGLAVQTGIVARANRNSAAHVSLCQRFLTTCPTGRWVRLQKAKPPGDF
jgi:NADH:ubiquinone oxidoreductase subunit 4 (subunit M)